MHWLLDSGRWAVLSLVVVAVAASAQSVAAANLPVSALATTLATQADYGTIKGRLVWVEMRFRQRAR